MLTEPKPRAPTRAAVGLLNRLVFPEHSDKTLKFFWFELPHLQTGMGFRFPGIR